VSERLIRPIGTIIAAAALALGFGTLLPSVSAQASSVASQPAAQPQGGRGGRGAPPGPLPTGRIGAPVDLSGVWVSVVTEDWEYRMRTPPKGDVGTGVGMPPGFGAIPLNPAGMAAANAWDPSTDGRCDAYGIGGIMRMPGRLKISWQDDLTLKIETDAGVQTRLLHFLPPSGPAGPAVASDKGARTLQGYSVAEWRRGVGFDAFGLGLTPERGAGPPRWGSLMVVTTNMLPGWLRRNGVPYSDKATITEHFARFTHPEAGDWFVVTTVVEDPTYLTQTFITSSNFKKEANDSKWDPKPCRPSQS
jgi:hypothetical protein